MSDIPELTVSEVISDQLANGRYVIQIGPTGAGIMVPGPNHPINKGVPRASLRMEGHGPVAQAPTQKQGTTTTHVAAHRPNRPTHGLG